MITLFAWDLQLLVHKVKPLPTGWNPDLWAQHPSQLQAGMGSSELRKPPVEDARAHCRGLD